MLKNYFSEGLQFFDWTEVIGSWTDGTLGGGFNGQWEADRPRQGLGDCVALSSCSGYFTNRPCSEPLAAICQMTACKIGIIIM